MLTSTFENLVLHMDMSFLEEISYKIMHEIHIFCLLLHNVLLPTLQSVPNSTQCHETDPDDEVDEDQDFQSESNCFVDILPEKKKRRHEHYVIVEEETLETNQVVHGYDRFL